MWQTDISIDTKYNLDKNICRYLKLDDFAFESTKCGERQIYSVIGKNNKSRDRLNAIITNIILVDMKYGYFDENIEKDDRNIKLLLLGEMLFFDKSYEMDYMKDILPYQYEYSLDGIFNFKIRDLRDNWDYLIELYNKVLDDDVLTLSKYLHDSVSIRSKKVYLTEKLGLPYMFDIRSGEYIDNIKLFDYKPYDTLFTILSEHTTELFVENTHAFDIDVELLENVVRIQFV